MNDTSTLGKDLRALRTARGMTLEDMANELERSVGWISQVERDISAPRMSDLQNIARLFDIPLSLLFGDTSAPDIEKGRIVRAPARRVMGEPDRGLIETLISPDLTDDFEVIHSTFRPGSKRVQPIIRPTQEVAYIVDGMLDIWLDDDAFTVTTGDSFRIRNQSYRWENPYDAPAIAIWVISPPVY